MNYLETLRHSASHVLAMAVLKLYPGTKLAIGPAIENGFYYDFGFKNPISEFDLPKIEEAMTEFVKRGNEFLKQEVAIKEALEIEKDQPYKKELILDLKKEGHKKVSFYKPGEFFDLCAGSHLKDTSKIGAFKLLTVAGAYWKGSENNPMLTRIYGTAFENQKDLEKHLWQLEEAKKRDHRKIGKELDLFTFSEEVGPGLPLWTPKGTIIREELENWAKETEKEWGYVRVATPHIGKHNLYEISGHIPYYKDDMYPPMNIDGEDYYLKGMNCPHHHMIYLSKPRSYKELPLRLAEYGTVYRYEQSGTLFGLMRARSIAQNDAHIYCTEEQADEEFLNVLKLHEYYYNTLGFTKDDYKIVIGLPDEKKKDKYHGDKKLWDKAEKIMRSAIKKSKIIHVDDIGGAAFYGPKIDFNVTSSIGKEFGISTNQLDLFMPRRFNLTYTDAKGDKKFAVVIHRAPLGSHERFIGFLIEHFGGAFPVWLSPVQVIVIPISDKNLKYAQKIFQNLKDKEIRVEIDDRPETMQAKIRKATMEKIPYMIIVGGKEESLDKISVRTRLGKDLGSKYFDQFISGLKLEIENKK